MRLMRRKNKLVKGSEAWWQDLVAERESGMPDWQRGNYRAILDAGGIEADALSGRARVLVLWLAEYVDEVVDSAVELVTAAHQAGATGERRRHGVTLREASADDGRGIVPLTFVALQSAIRRDPEAPIRTGACYEYLGGVAYGMVDVYDPDELVAWYPNWPGLAGGEPQ
jgi:hypothetical protein